MFLPGRLQSTTLGDVLGQLHRHEVSGILELIENPSTPGGRRHMIHLRRGTITHVETAAPVPKIGEVLANDGVLTRAQQRGLEQTLRRRPGTLAGALLLEGGMVSAQTLSEALACQMRMRVNALFGVRDAAVRFHAGGVRATHALPVSEYLQGRPRRRDRRPPRRQSEATESPASDLPSDPTPDARRTALAELGLGIHASREEVRHAFRRLASAVHPDLHAASDAEQRHMAQSKFAALSAAYHYLITH